MARQPKLAESWKGLRCAICGDEAQGMEFPCFEDARALGLPQDRRQPLCKDDIWRGIVGRPRQRGLFRDPEED